jgi:integral membrane protein (TIGR00529 family)
MYQLIAVIIAFLFIPLLIRFKFKLSNTLLMTAGILGIISGIGIKSIGESVLSVVLDKSSLTTILSVIMVTILSGLMKKYGILDKIVESMLYVIHNKKIILMIIPAMIGMLIVPGGALLSAPFINNLGEEMKVSPSRRAAINLVFRHISMFVLPYSTSLLIISGIMPEISIPRIILLNLIFVISMTVIGYYMYIRDITIDTEIHYRKDKKSKYILKLLIFTSPIYISVLINIFTGLPFYISLVASVILVYILSDKKDFLSNLIVSFNYQTVMTVVAIFIMKDIILKMEGLLSVFNSLFLISDSIYATMFIFLISSFFFGFITGNNAASLAILLPMISQLSVSFELLHTFIYFAYGCAFLGYFFSPLHLCQAFTVQHIGTTTRELYKEYKFFPLLLVVVLIISFLILV